MVYLDLVIVLNFLVDLLLILGTNSITGFPLSPGRSAAAALLGAVYAGVCMLPGFSFLGNTLWRGIFLVLMAVIAFGLDRSALRRGVLLVVLSMALGGIALGMGRGGFLALVGAAGALALMCAVGFRGRAGQQRYARVEFSVGNRKRSLTALLDTGNTLRDPISGADVLVVGADVAKELLGLTDEALCSPVQTLAAEKVPGLRLIPYRAVGQPGGMLLAVKPDWVRINGKERGDILAFAPHKLGNEGYQALAGGMI